MESKTFTNKVAIVTGGGTGLGKEMSLKLAREGAKVVIASRSIENLQATANLIGEEGGTVLVVPTDVRDHSQVRSISQNHCREIWTH